MGKIVMVCPSCKHQLSFNEFPGYRDKIFECKNCHFKAQFNLFQQGRAAQGGQGADEDSTRLPSNLQMSFDAGQLRVVRTGQLYSLAKGSNIIGRKASTSKASIQIEGDEYMSRQHVEIKVVTGVSGYEHHLVEINSTNPIQLNGREIQRNDIIKIKFGDCLTLGKTDVVLEHADTESTILDMKKL